MLKYSIKRLANAIPTLLILAAFSLLSDETIATLLGGVAGYIFGRGAESEKKPS